MRDLIFSHFFFLFCYPRDENFFAFLTTEDIDGDEQIRFSFYYYFMDQKNKRAKGEEKKIGDVSSLFIFCFLFLRKIFCQKKGVGEGFFTSWRILFFAFDSLSFKFI